MPKYNVVIPVWEVLQLRVEAKTKEMAESIGLALALEEHEQVHWQVDMEQGISVHEVKE